MQQNPGNKLHDWNSLVIEQEKSGLSQKEFCNQHGLVLSQFVYYRCSRNKNKAVKSAEPVFKSVKVIGKESSATGDIRLSLPNGFQCSFPCTFDVIQIKRLMEVLLSC